MTRNLQRKTKYDDIASSKVKYMETEDLSHFGKMERMKAKRSHDRLLESRLVFLMEGKVGEDTEHFLDQRMTCRKLSN